MKKLLINGFFLLLIPCFSVGQNYIKNGSLEELTINPDNKWPASHSYNTLMVGGGGYNLYFNSIYNDSLCHWTLGVPYNWGGFQYARTGNGYSLVGGNPPAFMVYPLSRQLTQGNCYNVRYFVSLTDRSYYAMDAIDGYFSKDSLGHEHLGLTDTIIPQFKNTGGIITDTMNWTAITGQYIANGKERYFAIGNFYLSRYNNYNYICTNDTAKINFGTVGDQFGFMFRRGCYYIEDLAIWECGLPEYPADAGPDKHICPGEDVEIGAMEQRDDYLYFWSDRSWLGPRHKWDTIAITPTLKVAPAKTTTYYLWCVDFKWEHTYDSVTVFVDDCDFNLEIPNVFTPNGDGINDYFLIGNPYGIKYTIDVYNRLGSLVFIGNHNFFWDGSFNGVPAYEGTYFYVIQAESEAGNRRREFKGIVTLLK